MEYKSAVTFSDKTEFGLKLVKHILGMANTGGGWIVIGYDDGTLQPDPNHSSGIAATYDTTALTDIVNKSVHKGQQVALAVHMELHPFTQQQHPIIEVKGFERTPLVCRSNRVATDTNKPILNAGKVYIRRPGAATSEVHTPSDWEDMLKRCVAQRRDEFLAEFADLFHRMNTGDATPNKDNWSVLEEWMVAQWAVSTTHEQLLDGGGYVEAGHMLVRSPGNGWTPHELREAAISAGPQFHHLISPVKDGIEARLKSPYRPEYWHIDKGGSYYFSIAMAEDYEVPSFSSSEGHPHRALWLDFTIYRIVDVLITGAKIYQSLGSAPNEPYLVTIRHGGIKGRILYAYDLWISHMFLNRPVNHVDVVEWRKELTQDMVNGDLIGIVHEIVSSLCTSFAFSQVSREATKGIVEKYVKNQT